MSHLSIFCRLFLRSGIIPHPVLTLNDRNYPQFEQPQIEQVLFMHLIFDDLHQPAGIGISAFC